MNIYRFMTACAAAASLVLSGCNGDNADEAEYPATVDSPVTFSLGMGVVTQSATLSRALTHESGFENENAIEDAIIIIYDKPLNDVGGEIVYKKYFGASELVRDNAYTGKRIYPASYDADGSTTTWDTGYSSVNRYTFEFGTDLEDGKTYYILALANVGDLLKGDLRNTPLETLDDLRNYVYKGDLCTAAGYPAEAHKFAMSAIGEEKFTYEKSKLTADSEYVLPDLYVQRLAARIDLVPGRRGNKVEHLADSNYDYVILDTPGDYPYDSNGTMVYFPIYDSENGSRVSGAVFALEKIAIFNAVDDITGEYLLERNISNGNTNIFGVDKFDTSTGYATYFVPCPPFMHSQTGEEPEGSSESHISYPQLYANKEATDKNNETYKGFLGDAARIHTLANGSEYAILGYVRENTFKEHSPKNRYTEVFFSGYSNLVNGHFDGSFDATYGDGNYVVTHGTIPLRHSTGILDTTKPMAYATVRNTIYRVRIRFYAKADTIYARYYYDTTDGTGSDDPDDSKYIDVPFNSFVLESDGKTPND